MNNIKNNACRLGSISKDLSLSMLEPLKLSSLRSLNQMIHMIESKMITKYQRIS